MFLGELLEEPRVGLVIRFEGMVIIGILATVNRVIADATQQII